MKKLIISGCIFLLMVSGCSKEYTAKQATISQVAYTESSNKRIAVGTVMQVVEKLIVPFEKMYKEKTVINTDRIKPTTDIQYGFYYMSELAMQHIRSTERVDLQRIRVEVFKAVQPIIAKIYDDHIDLGGDPLTVNGLLAKLVDQVPFMATVAGMYGLGVEAARKAGDQIAATFNGDNTGPVNLKGNLADRQGIVGNGNTSRDRNGNSVSSAEETPSEGEWYNGIIGCSTEESYNACLCSEKPATCQ